MPFDLVEKPIPGPGAFENNTDAGLLSQAGILLYVGARLRRKVGFLAEEASILAIPALAMPPGTEGTFLDPASVRGTMTRQLGERSFPSDRNQPIRGSTSAEIFETMTKNPDPVWTAGLLESCLRHPTEIVRVASAAAYNGFTTEKDRIVEILVKGTYSNELLVRDLAATALAQADPKHGRLSELKSKVQGASAGGTSHTTLLVHGTLARQQTWWQPTGDFHTYLTGLLPTLSRTPNWSAPYAVADFFDWTGDYTDDARADAAKQLVGWANSHGAQGLDLIGHSYGGDVAMLATTMGLSVGEIVLLSCPALPGKYFPEFSRVRGPVVSFRVRMDLVLLLDSYASGADAKFADSRIREYTLPIWFDHSATHYPKVWDDGKYNIPPRI